VVTTLANVAPAAGVAVTGMAAVKLAQGAVQLAAVGMDDALSAALDPSKATEFSEALEKLSPEARKFAQAVKDAAPALRDLQQDVQDRVFDGFADELERTGRSVLPVVRRSLLSTGDALNTMGKGVAAAARDLGESGTLGKALDSASKGLHNLSGVPGIVVKSLGQIAAAAGPSFDRLTERAADAAEGIGDRLTAAFEDGRMEAAIEDAIDLLGQIWDIGSNVVDIFQQIFNAVPEGGGILGVLEDVTGALAEAAATSEVQEGLRSLFETMQVFGETAAPLLADALRIIAPILAELAPPTQELIQSLGEGLQPILDELARGGLLEELAAALGEVMLAIAPLLPPLGELISAILPYLVPLVQRFADGVRVLAELIERLVVPAIQILTDILRGDFSSAMEGAKRLSADMVTSSVQSFATLPARSESAVSSLGEVLRRQAAQAGLALVLVTRDAVSDTVQSFGSLTGRALQSLSGLGAALTGVAISAGRQLSAAIAGAVTSAVAQVRTLQGKAAAALSGIGGVLVRAGASLISGFIAGIRSMIPSVRDVLRGITSMIPKEKGPPAKDAKLLTPAGRLLIEGLIRGIDESTAKLRARLESITKALPANVRSGIGKTLKKATDELRKLVTQRDAVIKRLAVAEKKLKDLVTARGKAAADITKGILGEANITTGHADVNSVSAITVGLQQALKATKEFQANISKLRAAGLRGDLLQQIADAGVDAGGATAAALARATPAELKKINDLQAQLAKSATATGNTVGDALYNAGIRAAQGLVNGLRSQEAAIERQMRRIAENMLKTVKKAHKTKSPSRAFWAIGEMDGEGLRLGLLASAGKVRTAARTVAGAALDVASGVGGTLAVTPTAAQLSQVYAGGGGDRYYTINLYGSDASPDGILRALSWQGLVGRGA
jgi:hypothetical protein